MNPKYCISLELAKRLKELGVKQESEFYWAISIPSKREWILTPIKTNTSLSAFTVGELGERLPKTFRKDETTLMPLEIQYSENGWWVRNGTYNDATHGEHHENLCEAMGLMLEYLIKNKVEG
jgi:hypothetical protein